MLAGRGLGVGFCLPRDTLSLGGDLWVKLSPGWKRGAVLFAETERLGQSLNSYFCVTIAAMNNSTLNRIAYINLDGQLCTTAPDGSDGRRLTGSERFFQFPAWSPSGHRLAAIGSARDDGGLFVLDPATSTPIHEPTPIYQSRNEAPIYLYWAPDGRAISFLAGHVEPELGLHVLPVRDDNFSPPVVEDEPLLVGAPLFWDWRADGSEMLAHVGFGSERARLVWVAAPGFEGVEIEPRVRANSLAPGYFQTPSISPSGHYWAYAERDEELGGGSQLVVESERERLPVGEHEGVAVLAWSPSGDSSGAREQLAFMSPPEAAQHFFGPLSLWDVATERTTLLVEDAALAFFWSPDGEHIAYLTLAPETLTRERDLLEADGDGLDGDEFYTNGYSQNGSGPVSNAAAASAEQEPLLALHVIHVASGESRRLHRFQPTMIFLNQFLPFFDQYSRSHRLWSPAGDALVLAQVQDGREQVCVVPLAGDVRPIAEGVMPFWSWR